MGLGHKPCLILYRKNKMLNLQTDNQIKVFSDIGICILWERRGFFVSYFKWMDMNNFIAFVDCKRMG